jgi:L-alanine-DL-glutamate epimerase-like enolase superfamily enzyme
VYATERSDPDLGLLREEAARYIEQGYTAVKQRFGFGPWDGPTGMKKNRAVVQTLREAIGDEVEQMVDCCRSFDADYAVRMMRMVEEFNLSWFEEPVLPHDWEGYVKVRQAATMPVAGGENEYSKQAFAKWLKMGCADIWQPDVDRCAGITEVQKIVHMAAANDIPVIPHGGWAPNFSISPLRTRIPIRRCLLVNRWRKTDTSNCPTNPASVWS